MQAFRFHFERIERMDSKKMNQNGGIEWRILLNDFLSDEI